MWSSDWLGSHVIGSPFILFPFLDLHQFLFLPLCISWFFSLAGTIIQRIYCRAVVPSSKKAEVDVFIAVSGSLSVLSLEAVVRSHTRWTVFPGVLERKESLLVDKWVTGGGGQLVEYTLVLIFLSPGSDFIFISSSSWPPKTWLVRSFWGLWKWHESGKAFNPLWRHPP